MTKTDTNPRDWGELKAFCQSENMCPIQRASTITDEAVLELIAENAALKSQRDEMAEALDTIEKGAPRETEYPNTYKGGFSAGCDWAGSIAREALRRARSSLNKTEKTDG